MKIKFWQKGSSRGVKLPHNKFTAKNAIETLPLPEKVIIPLHQNIGAPCVACVKRGEKVLTGQKIGDSDKFVNAPVHASISGTISTITTIINPPTGQPVTALVISSDREDSWVELNTTKNPKALSAREILGKIREAGIVGLGGATFPTHVKLSPPEDKKIDTIILNGCECEPYITADHRVMLEYGEKVLSGLNLISQILSPKNVYIGIEDNKADAITHLRELIAAKGYANSFEVVTLKSQYPMGAEKTLITNILHREVPIGGLPMDVGVVVQNVHTAVAIHNAVYEGRPFVERLVTVTGAVNNPKNLLVRLGTPLRTLIDYCGGLKKEAGEIILGGPMMGISQPDLDFPVTKGTSCILVTAGNPIREMDCINCGRCVEVCPMHLMPTRLAKNAKVGRYENCQEAYIDDCFECGSCAYSCPANIPIVQYIKVAKKELAKRRVAK
ncbi:MAG: electron transport complex subunit RsxC [Dehalococcoidales bacterium]|nr:electron transport complex subunit RsxC [Dehalococcoidales bacterium]